MKRLALLALAALAVAAASAPAADARRATRLRAFGSCAQLVRYGVAHAPRSATLPRVPTPAPVIGGGEVGAPVATAPAPAAGGGTTGGGEGEGTNVQEPGVDEPDIVKTDGHTLFAVSGSQLLAVAATGADPHVLDTLALPDGESQLLLHGSRLLVTTALWSGGTLLEEIDVSDPAHLSLSRTLRVDGTLLSSRMHDGSARVVLGARPQALIGLPVPVESIGLATAAARPRVSRKIGRWLPQGHFRSRISGRRWTRKLVGCRAVRHPSSFSGLDMLTVLTIDLDKGLWATDRDAILSDAETVYASATSLYVATRALSASGVYGDTTSIHRFDASTPRSTTYAASGAVPGELLNQFSLSEQDKVLRVATTAGDQSESRVITLEQRGSTLAELGRVGGLGHGERIYAVRFIGDVGYVVTFRQVDPLYTVDLADPAHPAVRGELKLSGYSAYLHPIGGDLLLGVGQDATASGLRKGVQVSLFDVADPAHPARLAQRTLGGNGSSTPVEYDHHAFLWWPAGHLAVLPVSDFDPASGLVTGAKGLRVERSGITEIGTIVAPGSSSGAGGGSGGGGILPPVAPGGGAGGIERAVVIDGALWTISLLGAGRADPATLTPNAWVPF
jgi:uncharacterized secreted protein with C-terminal beta-propeller domain